MPNWCWNSLLVVAEEGKENELILFKEFAKGTHKDGKENCLETTKFIPYPPEQKEIDGKYERWLKQHPGKEYHDCPLKDWFNQGGFEWCIANWGTKWGICGPSMLELTDEEILGKKCLEYNFDSAWSPPIPIIKKMGEMFPNLTFGLDYDESGMGFKGSFSMSGGEVSFEEHRQFTDEDWTELNGE